MVSIESSALAMRGVIGWKGLSVISAFSLVVGEELPHNESFPWLGFELRSEEERDDLQRRAFCGICLSF